MKSLIIHDILKAEFGNTLPILTSVFNRQPKTTAEINEVCSAYFEFIDKILATNKIIYSICDCTLLSPYSLDLLINIYISKTHTYQSLGLAFTAFVGPKNFHKEIDTDFFLKSINSNRLAFFDEVEEAEQLICKEMKKISSHSMVD